MKWNYKLSLALIGGFAIILPMSSFADDQTPDDKKSKSKDKHADKGASQAAAHVPAPTGKISQASAPVPQGHSRHGATVQQAGLSAPVPQGHVRHGTATAQQSAVSAPTSQAFQQGKQANNRSRGQNQPSSNQTYNKGNNYGGLWSAETSHSDWTRNGEHRWHNHNYRWYQGGWLIIDGGYSPYYASNTGSTVSNVQLGLAHEGYYHGAIDGDFGPGTRNAIANYQGDHDLRVTGRINDPLLQSLQLE